MLSVTLAQKHGYTHPYSQDSVHFCPLTGSIREQHLRLPDDGVGTDNELRFGVPLVVGNVVVSLQPNPLLTFGQEAIIAGFTLSKLHY